MWVQKFCKPSVRGNFGCIKPLLQSRIIGMDVGKYEGEWKDGEMHGTGTLKIDPYAPETIERLVPIEELIEGGLRGKFL